MNAIVTVAPFWIAVALILVAVLAWVLRPLFLRLPATEGPDRRELNIAVYRDQYRELAEDHHHGLLNDDQRDAARAELEARLARDALSEEEGPSRVSRAHRGLGLGLLAVIPALAVGFYLVAGEPGFIVEQAVAEQTEQERERKVQEALVRLDEKFDQALATLEDNVRKDPEDGLSWTFLANGYIARDRWEDAERAYEHAYALMPDTAVVVSGYAEAMAVNAGRDLGGRPIELVRKALGLDPEDPKALELAGIHAYQNREYTTAGYYWNQLLKKTPEATPAHTELTTMVRNARALGHTEAFGEPPSHGASATVVGGRVELAPELAHRVEPGDTVYLFARTATGSTQPLAALRTRLDQLPVAFTLDDSLALSTDHVLSNHESITLVARVSRTGDPEARPGDLEGVLEEVPVGRLDVILTIDRVTP